MDSRAERLAQRLKSSECVYISSPENVFYYSNFSGEGSLLISKTQKRLITDFRYITDAKSRACDYEIYDIKNGFKDAVFGGTKVLYAEEDHLTYKRYTEMKEMLPDIEIKDAGFLFCDRITKDETEIEKISKASKIAQEAFEELLKLVDCDVSEKQLAAEFEYMVKKRGAQSISFDTIVASGINSSMPHAVPTDKKIQKGDFITFDFGCKYEGYCSDMTRTVAYGYATDKMKNIYDIVLKAQETGLKNAAAQMLCSDVDNAARDIIASHGYGRQFGHALGHGVGIFIHEEPRLSPKCDLLLQDNMVVTVEPGIYLEGEFGVRIEDLVVVSGQSPKILTNFEKKLIII